MEAVFEFVALRNQPGIQTMATIFFTFHSLFLMGQFLAVLTSTDLMMHLKFASIDTSILQICLVLVPRMLMLFATIVVDLLLVIGIEDCVGSSPLLYDEPCCYDFHGRCSPANTFVKHGQCNINGSVLMEVVVNGCQNSQYAMTIFVNWTVLDVLVDSLICISLVVLKSNWRNVKVLLSYLGAYSTFLVAKGACAYLVRRYARARFEDSSPKPEEEHDPVENSNSLTV